MALFRKNSKLVSDDATGFGANSDNSAGRFVNRDGKSNVEKRGISLPQRYSWYHTMLSLPRWKFFLFIFSGYILINLIFATIYFFIGTDHFGGIAKGNAVHNFVESFFFSAQTFTTVGYGRISPVGYLASAVAAFEAFLGLMGFALATGLMYGRFVKPKAYLRFSDIALVSPYRDGTGLMFRIVPYKNNALTDVEVKVTIGMRETEGGKHTNRFYNLDLEFSKVNALSLSWTIVHPINEQSPLYGFTEENFRNIYLEMLVFVKAFDEDYSNTVVTRTSYINNEIVYGGRFRLMYHPDKERKTTILQVDLLNEYDKVELPSPVTVS